MIECTLLAHEEKLAASNPLPLPRQPLYHQMRTYEALADHDLVMNVYNTGTGKTEASLLHLFRQDPSDVLFIAPTNALIEQHARDIEKFVTTNELKYKVLRVTAVDLRQLDSEHRPGQVLHYLIRNYLQYEPDSVVRQPIILVTNPDIFYYAMFARYGKNDKRNLLEDFILRFNYIVIDEFHYYDSKQMANFLFVIALFKQFGYFDIAKHPRKLCLLSATPLAHVTDYLNRLLGNRWQMLSPDNEPLSANHLPTTPSLAPLHVTLAAGTLMDWLPTGKAQLPKWIQGGSDGAIISSSLAQINDAYHQLQGTIDKQLMGRITGPETAESRQTATARPLILASPTVDIGYNFDKKGKSRQNIDFLICDARHQDSLLQRLGRAGRTLGKAIIDQPSHVVVLLPEAAIASLKASLDGQTLTRPDFNAIIKACPELPSQHNLTRYIDTYSILESFSPIATLDDMMPSDLKQELVEFYELIRQIFAPESRLSFPDVESILRNYQKRRQWLQDSQQQISHNLETAKHVADWFGSLGENEVRYQPGDVVDRLDYILENKEHQEALRTFIQSQVTVTDAMFHFRDAFNGPVATIYDPAHLFSSETVNSYDLFHLLRNYELSPPLTPQQFGQLTTTAAPPADFYFQIKGVREQRLIIEFGYSPDEVEDTFKKKQCRAPIGITNLTIQARHPQGSTITGAFPHAITTALKKKTIVAMVITPESTGYLINRTKGSSLWPYNLTINFDDGRTNPNYRILLGTSALVAYAELKGHLSYRDRLASDPIII